MSSPQSKSDDLQEPLKQAQELISQGKMTEALNVYHSILEVDDRNIAAYHKIAQIYESQRNFSGAIENYKKAIEIDSDSPFWVYRHLGFALSQQGQLEEAVEAYRKAMVLQPDDIATYDLLGQVLEKKGDIDGSISSYQKAIELNLKIPVWVYLNLGNGLSQKECWEEAIEAYTKALELEPENTGIRHLLAAVTARKEADEVDPVAVAKRLQGEGKLEEALVEYRSVLEKDRGNLVALHQVARICENQGKWDEAVEHYRRAIEVDTEPPFWVYRHLGFALSQRGDVDGAVTAYEKAVELNPEDEAARSLLGEVLGNKRGYLEPQDSSQLKPDISNDFSGNVVYIAGNHIVGYLLNTRSITTLDEVRLQFDGVVISASKNNLSRNELANQVEGINDRCWFKLHIPDRYLDGKEYTFDVLDPDGEIFGQVVNYRFEVQGYLDLCTPTQVAGWIFDCLNHKCLELSLYLNHQIIASFAANLEREDVSDKLNCGFSFSVPIDFLMHQTVTITLKKSNIPVLGTPRTILSPMGAINAIYKLGQTVGNSSINLSEIEQRWILSQLLPNLIHEFRSSISASSDSVQVEYNSHSVIYDQPPNFKASSIVDVIVPVYKNYKVTKLCLESAIAAKNETAFNLIVINDRSPELEIDTYLEELEKQGRIKLIVNEVNRGFVNSVNQGMNVNCDRDVVLLNSDAIVDDYWLDRLKYSAYSQPQIASVTPISNHASIFSYPRIAEEVSELPDDVSLPELNEICHGANSFELIDVPTNHGFCCFLRRIALNEVGLFDEQKWGKGYGEEVDWAQRARRVGWRHVAMPGVFVQHIGSQSFTENKQIALETALQKLALDYPEFDAIVHDFVKSDPLAKYRRRIDLGRLKKLTSVYFLYIVHDFGGGTKRHITNMSDLLKNEDCHVLYLMPDKSGWIKLTSGSGIDIHSRYNLNYISELKALVEDLKEIQVRHVHIHSTIGFKKEDWIWQIAEKLGIEYDVTVHDYQYICPRVNLVTSEYKYCGEPSVEACDICILKNGTYKEISIENLYQDHATVGKWRSYFESCLQKARKVFAPSYDVKNRLMHYFPKVNLQVKPHPETNEEVYLKSQNFKNQNSSYKIAVIGSISDIKGYKLIYDCASYALSFNFPIEFIIFGNTKDDIILDELRNVTLTGAYKNFDELLDRVKNYPCDIAAFFSTWPETYSYTLSEALSLGLLPIGLNIGAIGERIRQIPHGILLDLHNPPEQIIKKMIELIQFSRNNKIQARVFTGNQYSSILKDYYEL